MARLVGLHDKANGRLSRAMHGTHGKQRSPPESEAQRTASEKILQKKTAVSKSDP